MAAKKNRAALSQISQNVSAQIFSFGFFRQIDRLQFFICSFLLIMPFLTTEIIVESPFEFVKLFFSGFSFLMLACFWTLEILHSEKISFYYNKMLILLGAYLGVTLVAFGLSKNTYLSFWGDVNLTAGSTFSMIVFLGIGVLISQISRSYRGIIYVLSAIGFMAFLMSAHSIIQHFELDTLNWWGYKQFRSRTLSTIGQPTSLGMLLGSCGFLLLAGFFAVRSKFLSFVFGFMWFCILLGNLYTGSRGPIVATNLLVLVAVGYLYLYRQKIIGYSGKKLIATVLMILIAHGVYFLEPSDNALAAKIQSEQVGLGFRSRLVVWTAAIELFKENPIIGVGPENFANEYNLIRDKNNNYNEAWVHSWTKAHNDYIQVLVTSGVVGFTVYMAFILFFQFLALRHLLQKARKKFTLEIMALTFTFTHILMNQVFAFNLNCTYLLFFLCPILLSLFFRGRKISFKNNLSLAFKRTTSVIILIGFCFLTVVLAFHWLAMVNYSNSTRLYAQSRFVEAGALIDKSTALDPDNFKSWCFKASIEFETFREKLIKRLPVTEQEVMKVAAAAEAASDRCVEEGKDYYESWRNRGLLFMEFSKIKPDYKKVALDGYQKSIQLSPTNPILHYDLGKAYLQYNEVEPAIASFKKSIELKNNYFPTYIILMSVYYQLKKSEDVYQLLRGVEKQRLTDPESILGLKELLKFTESRKDLVAVNMIQALLDVANKGGHGG